MENREIKFRGKTKSVDVWVYGYYIHKGKQHCIWDNETLTMYEVHPESVGQYTGLKDKNGVDVYERDIVKSSVNERLFNWIVVFHNGGFKIRNIGVGGYLGDHFSITQSLVSDREIIGNTFDNPELIK